MAIRPRTIREEQIASSRGRGLPAIPPIATPSVATGAPTGLQPINRTQPQLPGLIETAGDPRIAAGNFENRMAEIREFSATNPELQFQRASATASRQTTPEARAATLASLTQQQLGTAAEERIQALKGQSTIEAAQARAVGTAETARLQSAGKEGALRFKEVDALNDSIFDQQKMIDEGGPAAAGHKALRDRLIERRNTVLGVTAATEGEGAVLGLNDFIADFTAEQGSAPSQAQIDRAEGRFWR